MGSERVLVVSRGIASRPEWDRIDASTPTSALGALDALVDGDDMSSICAVLADGETALSHDDRVALVSVLVLRGVRAFETNDPQTVTRILDTHFALSSGQIEVLES